ncbi:MAG: hypothetical protein ABL964_16230 [Steroidobacteraceae bacterium]
MTLAPGVQEAAPLVHDGTMYFPNPSDLVQAIDAATQHTKRWVECLAAANFSACTQART